MASSSGARSSPESGRAGPRISTPATTARGPGRARKTTGRLPPPVRHVRLDAGLEVPPLLEPGDEGAHVLVERRVHEGPARLRAQATEEERVRVPQLHAGD